MRADRMLSILLLLQNEGKMTSKELAQKLEVAERTVIRDMESLSMAGVPVYAERGSRGGWLLAEGYRTNLTGMKTEEFISLMISAHPELLNDLGIKEHFETAFQKLMASSPAPIRQTARLVRQKIHIDGAGWHQANESCPYLAAVQEAVLEERKLCIHYKRENDKEIFARIVHPLGLVAKRSVWYLIAESEGEFRTYRISRIVKTELLEPFPRPTNFDLASFWEQSTVQFKRSLPRYPARLRMSGHLLSRFQQERYVKVTQVKAADSGRVEAAVEFATLEHGCEMILGFGVSVEVIAPEELRAKVISEALGIVDLYIHNSAVKQDAAFL